MKKVLCVIISALFLLSALCACKSDSEQTDTTASSTAPDTTETPIPVPSGEYRIGSDINVPEYEYGEKIETSIEKCVFESIEKSGAYFGLHRDAATSGATLTVPPEEVGGIYTLSEASADTPAEYTFRITCDVPANDYTWFTCYFGLRLDSAGADPTRHNGVWIAMRGKQVGMRVGVWPETSYFAADWDLAAGELVTVVDDPVENRISIFAGEEKRPIAYLTIEGRTVRMYSPTAENPKITDRTDLDVISGGFCHLWAHITPNGITATDISATIAKKTVVKLDNNGIKENTRDVFADTYVAADDVGRVTLSGQTKPNGAKVGIFYFLWHESSNNGKPLYDHTAAYTSGGMDALWKTLAAGELGFVHYWSEPYFGYYCSDDEWVIRKHGSMLAEAGVDFVYFDVTNGPTYPKSYEAVLRVWSQMRKEGLRTPDFCFLMQGGNTKELSLIWNSIYNAGMYSDLWFLWDGKPVIMFTDNSNKLTAEQKDFFTVRISWANEHHDWYNNEKGINCWAWGTMYPQKGGFVKENGGRSLEQMCVMCGFWVNGSYDTNAGRSYTKATGEPKELSQGDWNMGFGLYPQTSGLGLAYQEQFDRAIDRAPRLIMITGWNEWWAGRWETPGQMIAYEYVSTSDKKDPKHNIYVDNFNPEYSRDIEPMKGGFGDNYYYQTVMNVRTYKGSRSQEAAFGQRTIDIGSDAVQWLGVGPEFRDVYGDVAHRNHPSHVGGMRYTDDSGRNDILTCKVSVDAEYLYIYADCADDITAPGDAKWMNLFLKTDGSDENGWYGFDYVINRERDGGACSVEKFTDGWNTEKAGEAEYVVSGKRIAVKISRALVGYNGETLDFKWADNSVDDGQIMSFIDKGDAAPDGRFCFRYTEKAAEKYAPECLTADMSVFKVNGYNAYIGGVETRLVPDNTEATLLASGTDFWLPVYALERIGVSCAGYEVLDHYGVDYVKGNEPVEKSGKVVTVTTEGLLIIAGEAVTDTAVLDTLYRSLH